MSSVDQELLVRSQPNHEFATIRDKCICALILATAIFAEELIALSVTALDLKDGYLHVDNNNRNRIVKLDLLVCHSTCKEWLQAREEVLGLNGQKCPLLFFSERLKPLNRRLLYNSVSKYLTSININKSQLGPALLRQTAIYNLAAAGKAIEEIKAVTGIRTLANIEKYYNILTH